jgi:hypothetical protein
MCRNNAIKHDQGDVDVKALLRLAFTAPLTHNTAIKIVF